MSLQVNLILDSERRSGSSISPQFVIRTTLIVIGALAAMGVFSLMIGARSARQNLIFIKNEQKGIEPVYKSVIQARGELTKIKALVDLIEGWHTNRMAMSPFLRGFQLCVPESIQLTRLTMQSNLENKDGVPHWSGSIYIRGRVSGAGAGGAVRALHVRLQREDPFERLLADVAVKRFAADENDLQGELRVFDIEGGVARRKIPLTR